MDTKKGIVIKTTGAWYTILSEGGVQINCRIKGKLRIEDYKSTNPLAVGDRVSFQEEADGTAVITEVENRKNCIIRKSINLSKQSHILATNIDQAMLLVTLAAPKTSFGFIDRFLATAEAYSIPSVLVFNKSDLFDMDKLFNRELEEAMSLYEKIGYRCYRVSSINLKEEQKETMISLLKDKITLLAGHSGVGKSTFVNAIEPNLDLKTQGLSRVHSKGMHTTTFSEMHALSFGGFIIDTPGIKEFSVINFDKNEVSHFFPEIFEKAADCKYNTCLHLNEPKCAVMKAVNEGEIAVSRYHSYLSIITGEEVIKEYDD